MVRGDSDAELMIEVSVSAAYVPKCLLDSTAVLIRLIGQLCTY